MSYLTRAFTDMDDPYWACFYGVTTHPLYRECKKCPSKAKCDLPAKEVFVPKHDPPPDCPGRCISCPKPIFGECHFWDD